LPVVSMVTSNPHMEHLSSRIFLGDRKTVTVQLQRVLLEKDRLGHFGNTLQSRRIDAICCAASYDCCELAKVGVDESTVALLSPVRQLPSILDWVRDAVPTFASLAPRSTTD
jgi:hypothetical protein